MDKLNSRCYEFFRIILDIPKKLELPEKFSLLHGPALPSSVTLETPCGTRWEMSVLRRDGVVWLHHGWPEFAAHFSLAYGHFLIFRYDGSSLFAVSICDSTTCQISYPPCRPKSAAVIKLEEPPLTPRSPADTRRRLTVAKAIVPAPETTRGGISEPCSPSFVATMTSSMVLDQYTFELPSKFWKSHLHAKPTLALLEDPGKRSWPVRISVRELGKSRPFFERKGWEEFARTNNLVSGDECTFELTNVGSELSFKVSISRAASTSRSQRFKARSRGEPMEVSISSEDSDSERSKKRPAPSCKPTEALREAKKFMSPLPFFIGMIGNRQNYNLHVRATFGHSYFERRNQTVTIRAKDNKAWDVSLVVCPSGYFLCRGYGQFVKENKLRAGDVCVYELIERKNVVLRVSFFRN